MNKVNTYQQVLDEIRIVKNLKKGFITNFYPDVTRVSVWINSGELFTKRAKDVLFLFRERKEFYNLYYCAPSHDILHQAYPEMKVVMSDKHIIVDLLGKKSDVIVLNELFKKNDFYDYITLCRMSKSTGENDYQELSTNLRTAEFQHSDSILELLYTYFDPIAEQLPSYEEITRWIKLGHISIYESGGKIRGFVIYDLIGLTSYLRYWFVHPKHRDKKIGSTLIKKYFTESKGTKRQLFWVIQSNNNAIMRYKHYGFNPENMFDIVMTNKEL